MILHCHPSQYFYFSVSLRTWVLVRPAPGLEPATSSALSTEQIFPRSTTHPWLCPISFLEFVPFRSDKGNADSGNEIGLCPLYARLIWLYACVMCWPNRILVPRATRPKLNETKTKRNSQWALGTRVTKPLRKTVFHYFLKSNRKVLWLERLVRRNVRKRGFEFWYKCSGGLKSPRVRKIRITVFMLVTTVIQITFKYTHQFFCA